MWRLSKPRTPIIFLLVLPIGCVGFALFVSWRSNQVSPTFLSASQTSYRLIRECDDRISEEDLYFDGCIKKGQDTVEVLRSVARTQRERLEYAFLRAYLIQVDDCHRDRLASDETADAKARTEQLVRIRKHAEESYKSKLGPEHFR
jgi:hypothetical protein